MYWICKENIFSYSSYILVVVGSTKLAIPHLPFVWKRHFVAEENSSDCVPACVAMCARLWNDIGLIKIPTDKKYWDKYFEKLGVSTPRGTNLSQIGNAVKRIKPQKPVLEIDAYYPTRLSDVAKLFETKPIFPVILNYDLRMIQHMSTGVHHASLFHSFDPIQKRVLVVDPASQYRTEPNSYYQEDFYRGWEETGQEILIPHPSNIRVPINMRQKVKHRQLNTYDSQ